MNRSCSGLVGVLVIVSACSGKPVTQMETVATATQVDDEVVPEETTAVAEEQTVQTLSQRCGEDLLVCVLEVASLPHLSPHDKEGYLRRIALAYAYADRCDMVAQILSPDLYDGYLARDLLPYCSTDLIEEIVNGIDDQWSKKKALAEVALAMAEAGEATSSINLLSSFPEGMPKEECGAEVALAMASVGDLDEAMQILSAMKAEFKRERTTAEVALILAEKQECDEAQEVLEELGDVKKDVIEVKKVKILATCGEIAEAEVLANAIAGKEDRALALSSLAQMLGKKGDEEAALALMGKVKIDEKGEYARPVVAISVGLGWIEAGKVKKAQKVCKSYKKKSTRENCLGNLVEALASKGEYEAAMKTASMIKDEKSADKARVMVAEVASKAQELHKIEGMVDQVKKPWNKWGFLVPEVEQLIDQAKYDEALAVIEQIGSDDDEKDALGSLALMLASKGEYEKAHEVAPPPYVKPKGPSLLSFIPVDHHVTIESMRLVALVNDGEVESVKKEVASPEYGYDTHWAMIIIAGALVDLDRMQEALHFVLQIEDPKACNQGLLEISGLMNARGSFGWGLVAALSLVESEHVDKFHPYVIAEYFKEFACEPPADKLPLQISNPELGAMVACLIDEQECE